MMNWVHLMHAHTKCSLNSDNIHIFSENISSALYIDLQFCTNAKIIWQLHIAYAAFWQLNVGAPMFLTTLCKGAAAW